MSGYYDRDRTLAAGTMQYPKTYIGNTAEYLVSGWPYVKTITNSDGQATTFTLNLNYVTSEIKIQAIGEDITITLQGSSDTFVVYQDTTITLPVKATKLSFTNTTQDAGITVIAALTNIRASQYPTDSWSGGTVTES